jgi:2-polyprenyl-6-methoxyphenol hydroxylase-like FAD-dependent oxidoreductase
LSTKTPPPCRRSVIHRRCNYALPVHVCAGEGVDPKSTGDSKLSADIIVAGAGAAGATAAAVLGQQGWRVVLLDARPTCPPVFKAEKLEQQELSLLRDFGLLEPLLRDSWKVSEVYAACDGRIYKRRTVEQLGMRYADLVNALRANLPPGVETRVGRADRISRDGETTRVHLASGDELTARLVILACGVSGQLPSSLGLRRRVIQKEQCVTLGFDIVADNSHPFPFHGVTYYPTNAATRIDYLTLFKIGRTTRANLFVFRSSNDPWIRAFMQEPRLQIERVLPKLPRVIGEFQVASKVECSRVDLYRTEGDLPAGVVCIGDALQNTCPSTGFGLKRVFTHVDVLAECVPEWFSTPGMGAEKFKTFYDHPRVRFADAHALRRAFAQRRAATDMSLRWRLYRGVLRLNRTLSRPINLPRYPIVEFERA